jgi:hypothetical protein
VDPAEAHQVLSAYAAGLVGYWEQLGERIQANKIEAARGHRVAQELLAVLPLFPSGTPCPDTVPRCCGPGSSLPDTLCPSLWSIRS